MKRLRKFLGLPPTERNLLVTAAFVLGLVRVGMWLLPFRTLRRLLARMAQAPAVRRRGDQLSPDRIAWAVEIASRYVPGGRTCLVQALSTQVLLARQSHSARLRIGVAKGRRGQLEAHAWVESEGKVVIGGVDVARFIPFSALEGES